VTTEDDFQLALDANPRDWHTRLVFADWLQDRSDPRAAGFRAIALNKRYPLSARAAGLGTDGHWWHRGALGEGATHNNVPDDWFALLPPGAGNGTFWPVYRHDEDNLLPRRDCESALALAFADLPPERQAELLSAPVPFGADEPDRTTGARAS
jgi:uncharacterized protein (TIGR02996 family)